MECSDMDDDPIHDREKGEAEARAFWTAILGRDPSGVVLTDDDEILRYHDGSLRHVLDFRDDG